MKRILLFTLLMAATTYISAQNSSIFSLKNWKIKKIGVTMGIEQDMVNGMNADFFMKQMIGNSSTELSNTFQFDDANVYSMVCENPHIHVDLTLQTPLLKNWEVRFGAIAVFNRIDGITYQNHSGNFEYLSLESFSNEVALEAAVLKTLPLWDGRINLHGGLGTNFGYTFGNSMYVWGSSDFTVNETGFNNVNQTQANALLEDYNNHYALKDGINQRLYGQIGMDFVLFGCVGLGVEYRRGYGYRMHGGDATLTSLNSTALTMRYHLK